MWSKNSQSLSSAHSSCLGHPQQDNLLYQDGVGQPGSSSWNSHPQRLLSPCVLKQHLQTAATPSIYVLKANDEWIGQTRVSDQIDLSCETHAKRPSPISKTLEHFHFATVNYSDSRKGSTLTGIFECVQRCL